MTSPTRFFLVWICAVVLTGVAWLTLPHASWTQSARIVFPPKSSMHAGIEAPAFAIATHTVFSGEGVITHAPTIALAPDGKLHAMWFAGSDEAQADVGLYGSVFDNGTWSSQELVLNAETDSRERGFHVNTIGNPVLHFREDGEGWLFYVTPSLGGWATSRISLRRSSDGGESWGLPRTLVTSPFFNMSMLVRSACPAGKRSSRSSSLFRDGRPLSSPDRARPASKCD